ncbi:hypothetical protein Y601_4125 [Burkholderia pseudomallei MSHR640]|nr:hypothetical protein Y601_4125 [Burkholderia pseudomallei MSHR640]
MVIDDPDPVDAVDERAERLAGKRREPREVKRARVDAERAQLLGRIMRDVRKQPTAHERDPAPRADPAAFGRLAGQLAPRLARIAHIRRPIR